MSTNIYLVFVSFVKIGTVKAMFYLGSLNELVSILLKFNV